MEKKNKLKTTYQIANLFSLFVIFGLLVFSVSVLYTLLVNKEYLSAIVWSVAFSIIETVAISLRFYIANLICEYEFENDGIRFIKNNGKELFVISSSIFRVRPDERLTFYYYGDDKKKHRITMPFNYFTFKGFKQVNVDLDQLRRRLPSAEFDN